MSEHAMLSASGAARWLNCTPSARLETKFPNVTSEYAIEGTVAHTLAEITTKYWLGKISEMEFENAKADLAKTDNGIKYYNTEMQEYINDYAKLISDKLKEAHNACSDALVELEVKVDFSKWVPAGFGTSDCVIIADNYMEVVDLKYGKGHRVEATNNPQMRLYALGALEVYGALYNIETVKMTIFQPRLAGIQSSDEITVEDLIKWADEVVKPKAKLAYDGKGKFMPSDETCKFCRAKAKCRARYDYNIDLFNNAEDPLLITPEEAGQVLAKASDIKAWLSDIEDLVQSAILSGENVSGWKMVEGKSNRKYADEKAVIAAMKAAGYTEDSFFKKSLLPITQMEKEFGKKEVAGILGNLIIKLQGAPTLAPITDKRPAIQPDELVLAAFDK